MKIHALRAALVLALVLATAGCSGTDYAAHIERVIAADTALFGAMPEKPAAKDVRAYADAMAKIDLRNCPEDFQRAFLKHTYAWNAGAAFVEEWGGWWGKTVIILLEIVRDPRVRKEAERLHKEIEDTWIEVEAVALRYGVPVHEYRQSR